EPIGLGVGGALRLGELALGVGLRADHLRDLGALGLGADLDGLDRLPLGLALRLGLGQRGLGGGTLALRLRDRLLLLALGALALAVGLRDRLELLPLGGLDRLLLLARRDLDRLRLRHVGDLDGAGGFDLLLLCLARLLRADDGDLRRLLGLGLGL